MRKRSLHQYLLYTTMIVVMLPFHQVMGGFPTPKTSGTQQQKTQDYYNSQNRSQRSQSDRAVSDRYYNNRSSANDRYYNNQYYDDPRHSGLDLYGHQRNNSMGPTVSSTAAYFYKESAFNLKEIWKTVKSIWSTEGSFESKISKTLWEGLVKPVGKRILYVRLGDMTRTNSLNYLFEIAEKSKENANNPKTEESTKSSVQLFVVPSACNSSPYCKYFTAPHNQNPHALDSEIFSSF